LPLVDQRVEFAKSVKVRMESLQTPIICILVMSTKILQISYIQF
jgi:hypothetical protein